MKKKVEIFIAGCTVCSPVVDLLKSSISDNCELIIYDLIKQCESKECLIKVHEYGIKAIPSIAVDGKLLKCFENKGISKEELINAGIIKNS